MKIAPPFGIDLGTTRSAAAVFLPGASEPIVATGADDSLTIPSVLRAVDEERWHAGFDALESSNHSPLVASVKRHMGSSESVRNTGGLLPEEASAIILATITARMKDHLARLHPDRELVARDAVITVPAYFDAPQIEATRRAGELTGLRVRGLVQEPTAAAIYHTWNHDLGDGTFLVYDLGGGTFDVSIIRSLYGEYQVLAIDGDNHLGGDDFDRRLADLIRSRLIDDGYDLFETVDTEADRDAFEALTTLARQVKEALSQRQSVHVSQEGIFDDRGGRPVDVNLRVNREEFDESITDLLEATILSCRRAVESANGRHGLDPTDIDGIFLVGGSTRVPSVQQLLQETMGAELEIAEECIIGDEPETSVARGAALHAAAVCPLRFETDRVCIAVTDLPSDNPDRLLIGHVDTDLDPAPTRITFGMDDDIDGARQASLEHPGDSLRFSVDEFYSEHLAPAGTPEVATGMFSGAQLVFGPQNLWLPDRPEDTRPAPTLALTNPAVLAKDINVEVVEDGRPSRHTLIAAGTHLPTTAHHRLVTGDRSGSLVLRLFQHRLPIHTMVLAIPEDTPPGTPVELSVDVDQAMNLIASGTVNDQTFHVRIDRPSTPRRRRWEEIEELIDRTDDVARRLWGVEARRFHARCRNLIAGIRAASRQDPDRLQVLARRLEALLEDYGPRPTRSPGRNRIDTLLDTIRRVVFTADDERLGRSLDEWRRHLEQLSAEVDRAWRGDDDRAWQSVADRVQATYESIAQDEYLFRRRDPDSYARTLFETTQGRLQQVRRQADQFPYAADHDSRKLQRQEVQRILSSIADLQDKFPRAPDPSHISRLERIARSVTHLEQRLDRVHTLGVPRSGESP